MDTPTGTATNTHLVRQGIEYRLLVCNALRVICHRQLNVGRVFWRMLVARQRAAGPQQAATTKEARHGVCRLMRLHGGACGAGSGAGAGGVGAAGRRLPPGAGRSQLASHHGSIAR